MTPHATPTDHPVIPKQKVGILLVNLGTPDGTDAGSVRRYLREFLSDKRVVDYPRAFWLPLLHGIILNTRPAKTGRAYKKIWREQSDESPLRYYTRQQAAGVHRHLNHDDDPHDDEIILVDWAMRYGSPSIRAQMTDLMEQGCTRLLIVPLYPQYSATTTATVVDEVARVLQSMTWQPSIRVAPPFYDHPGYIDALAQVTANYLDTLETPPDRVILSFHGIPERYFKNGDPYHCHCAKTARLLRETMGWSDIYAPLAFQSKFGPEKWLGPATDDLIEQFGRGGHSHIAVITPAFVSDCIETLEEIAIAGKELFVEAGGAQLSAVPCLNDSEPMAAMLGAMIERELKGWV